MYGWIDATMKSVLTAISGDNDPAIERLIIFEQCNQEETNNFASLKLSRAPCVRSSILHGDLCGPGLKFHSASQNVIH